MKTRIAALAATLLLASGTANAASTLDGPAVKQLLSGALMTGETDRGYSYRGEFLSDGTLRGFVRQGEWKDTGKWWVDGDQYCRAWSEWREGTTSCWKIESVGNDQYRFHGEGSSGRTYKIVRL